MPNNIVLGAGIAGISASYHLKQKGISSTIYEKDSDWGGLCGFFEIDGFRFDRFVHFTFTTDDDATKAAFFFKTDYEAYLIDDIKVTYSVEIGVPVVTTTTTGAP